VGAGEPAAEPLERHQLLSLGAPGVRPAARRWASSS
jgi:hypothetical protein